MSGICVLTLWLACPALVHGPGQQANTSAAADNEIITIDGRKNPELIPQWAAWRSAFNVIRGAHDVPTAVYIVATREERALLVKDAETDAGFYKECESRALKLRDPVVNEPNDTKRAALIARLQPRADAIELECRQHTLDLRNQVLQALSSATQSAVRNWVEAGKSGMQITLRKADLKRYRLPE